MRIPRIFYPFELESNSEIELDLASSNHLKVIKIKSNQVLEIFNGRGFFCEAVVLKIDKKIITLQLGSNINFVKKDTLQINMAIAEIKNFDKIIREACQLGVTTICCIQTSRTKFTKMPSSQKLSRWETVAINSCEQCGLNWKPKILVISIEEWIKASESKNKLVLNPQSPITLSDVKQSQSFDLAIGPEGGFSSDEIDLFQSNNFQSVSCGNLIFKTETMPIVVLSMVKALFGDI